MKRNPTQDVRRRVVFRSITTSDEMGVSTAREVPSETLADTKTWNMSGESGASRKGKRIRGKRFRPRLWATWVLLVTVCTSNFVLPGSQNTVACAREIPPIQDADMGLETETGNENDGDGQGSGTGQKPTDPHPNPIMAAIENFKEQINIAAKPLRHLKGKFMYHYSTMKNMTIGRVLSGILSSRQQDEDEEM